MNSTITWNIRTFALSAVIAAAALLALAPGASAGKIVDRVVAGTQAAGSAEGQFNEPDGIAFNDPGIADGTTDPEGDSTDGYLYAADTNNHRIQVFDADGDFKFTFGRGVLTGSDDAEVCDHTQTPCQAGTSGSDEGELASPRSITINQQTGDIYVYGGGAGGMTISNRRIDQFAADGTFVRAWGWGVATGGNGFEICESGCLMGISGANGGQFNFDGRRGGIAVDPSPPHHLFFADYPYNRVQEFTSDGNLVRLWGWDVVSAGKVGDIGTDVFEVCSSAELGVCQAGSGSGPPTDGKPEGADAIVVDVQGIAYVNGRNGVFRFDTEAGTAAAMPLPRLTLEAGLLGISNALGALAIGPGDSLFVAYDSVDTAAMVSVFDTSVEPPVPAGLQLISPPLPPGIPPPGLRTKGLAVDPSSGEFVFTGSGTALNSELGHRLFAADEDGAIPPPTLAVEDPSSTVDGPNVTFSGEVTPNGPPGIPTTYNFQYRKLGSGESGWIDVPAAENPLGDGNAPVEVTDEVSDLQPNTDYEVRLAARKAFGNPQVESAALTFTSAAIPPAVKTLSPTARSASTVTLSALVNPNNSATSYRFEWGETAGYGNVAPIPAGDAGDDFGDRLVAARLEGLQPETTYHYRVLADNGVEVSAGVSEVAGEDVSFSTREAASSPGGRELEMVTPPFKVTRATGLPQGVAGDNPNPTIASLDGDTVHWNVSILPLTDDVASPLTGDKRIIRRTANGWVNATRNTLGLLPGTDPSDEPFPPGLFTKVGIGGTAGDFETLTWVLKSNRPSSAGLLPAEGKYANRAYTRRDGTGTKGFTAWLTNPEQQIVEQGFLAGLPSNLDEIIEAGNDIAILNDSGSAMARWGHYRGLAEDPGTAFNEDPSDEQQLDGLIGGSTAYVQRATAPGALPTAGKELVNGCTGTVAGGNATLIPARLGSGAPTDTIGAQACTRGNVVNVRGAVVGDRGGVRSQAGRAATALADDGSRVFFQSPDRFAATSATGSDPDPSLEACATATGSATACPPQLFVRQYGGEGEAMVRWISRSRSVATGGGAYGGDPIAGQQVAEMGAGVRFEGASRDGSVVYFRTNAPLTPDDPNGGKSIVTDAAQESSWDLYRYVLPTELESDPADGTLMRVSGGPGGDADPGTNASSEASTDDASIRFHSDDGSRAYFLTTAKIEGADETAPSGASTTPGGAVGNSTTRNLYLFDAAAAGTERWKFIARLPYATGSVLDACASSSAEVGDSLSAEPLPAPPPGVNCFRGTPSGDAVLFTTTGRLTEDDLDNAADVYLYDAEAGELVRLTAPPAGQEPYVCHEKLGGIVAGSCNGELGRNIGRGFFTAPIGPWEVSRGWGGMRYYNLSTDENGVVSAYFATELALVEEDSNGEMDVYEWRAGELSMISPPGTPSPSWFSGNSLDGRDVFFATGARLDPREIDDADLDVYDARIGGGFEYVPPPVPCDVLALGCESAAIGAPAARQVTTAGFAGPGNVRPTKPRARRCPKGKVRRAKRCAPKAALARKHCRKAKGKAKRRCVRTQVRKLTRAQQRRAKAKGRASR